MGTNYYVKEAGTKCCPNCGFGNRHIGKSSYGWHFALRVYPDENITSLEDWKNIFYKEGVEITNEYKDPITPDEMINIITNRSRDTYYFHLPPGYKSEQHFLEVNKATWGFNKLLKHASPDVFGHGDGPYDFIVGDFS